MVKRILIVDDSPLIHNVLSTALKKHGYEVCGVANNGRDGVALFEKEQPDLVFMDITMPIMDGIEALTKIKSKFEDANVIMLTAMGDNDILRQAENAGAIGFLRKPFNELRILSAINQIS